MDYQGAVCTNGVSYTSRNDAAALAAQQQLAAEHAQRVLAKLNALAA